MFTPDGAQPRPALRGQISLKPCIKDLPMSGVLVTGGLLDGIGDGWLPGVPGKRVAQGGKDAGSVLCGGGQVTAGGVALAGGFLRAEPAGYVLLDLRLADVPFGLVGCGQYPQDEQKPEDVVLAVAQPLQSSRVGGFMRMRSSRGSRADGQVAAQILSHGIVYASIRRTALEAAARCSVY
jgi:hypothetical protein